MSKTYSNLGGLSKTPEYFIWRQVLRRCYCPDSVDYVYYGARGVGVYEEWRTDFLCFLNDVGRRPSPLHSLDRIDPDGWYEPGWVRWATSKEQGSNRLITFNEVTMCLADWADVTGIKRQVIETRLRRGWDPKKILETPVRPHNFRVS